MVLNGRAPQHWVNPDVHPRISVTRQRSDAMNKRRWMNTLQGRVVVITGAAGGLGSALSRGFAREGCRLFLTDKHEGRLTEIMAELAKEGATCCGRTRGSGRCFPNRGRLSTAPNTRSMARLTLLVNNAGISRAKSFWDLTEEDWDSVLDVNVKALFYALRAVGSTAPCSRVVVRSSISLP